MSKNTISTTKKRNTSRIVLLSSGWVVALVFAITTAQAQHERNILKDQASASGQSVAQLEVIADPQLDYVNAVRAKYNVALLQYDDGLLQSAKAKTKDMIERQYWSHTTPDGQSYVEAAETIRPSLRYYGENIAQCFNNHKQMSESYEQSPTHLVNMINPDFTFFGSSTQWDKQKQCYVNTHHFGG